MEEIVSITHQRSKVTLMLSSGERIQLSKDAFMERPLNEGDIIDLEEYDRWLLLRQYRPALNKAVALLAVRARSKGEIEQKLLAAGYRPCTAEMVIYKLEKEHLLNDAEFAAQWAESRMHSKVGSRRIAMELRRKGVSADKVADALESIPEDEQLRNAVALAEKAAARAKDGEDRRKTYQRTAALLSRRGYSWDITKAALDELFHR